MPKPDAAPVIRSLASRADLEEIWQFIARDSEFQADRWFRIIDEKIMHLARHNGLGRPRPELAADLRSYPVKDHVIFYQQLGAQGVAVVRVLHSSRDISAEMFGNS